MLEKHCEFDKKIKNDCLLVVRVCLLGVLNDTLVLYEKNKEASIYYYI